MPVLSYHHYDFDDQSIFLGTCEYTKRKAFEEKLQAWCVAYDKVFEAIVITHHYIGSVV